MVIESTTIVALSARKGAEGQADVARHDDRDDRPSSDAHRDPAQGVAPSQSREGNGGRVAADRRGMLGQPRRPASLRRRQWRAGKAEQGAPVVQGFVQGRQPRGYSRRIPAEHPCFLEQHHRDLGGAAHRQVAAQRLPRDGIPRPASDVEVIERIGARHVRDRQRRIGGRPRSRLPLSRQGRREAGPRRQKE
jgi:hypothetical protein